MLLVSTRIFHAVQYDNIKIRLTFINLSFPHLLMRLGIGTFSPAGGLPGLRRA